MQNYTRNLLALLCAVAMLFSLVSCGTQAQGEEGEAPNKVEANSVAKILERDGYLEGIWWPWFTHDDLGHGLTANETMVKYVSNAWSTVGVDKYSDKYLLEQIYNLKALGFNIMGYEGSIYAEGVIFDEAGDVLGIKEDYLQNVRRLLNVCRQAEMPVLWTVCCHSTSAVSYYNLEVWYRMTQMYAVKEVADHYVERFVKPLCAVLAEYPDVVVMCATTSEVENEMNDPDMGNFTEHRETYGVTKESMLYFVNAVADTLAAELPNVDRTLCGSTDNMTMYSETNLTFIGHQEYNANASADDISKFRSPLPMLATEFGLGDGKYPTEDELVDAQLTFRNNFKSKGWSGWFMWCWSNQSGGSSYDLIAKNGGITDFRKVAYEIHDYIEEYRAEYRGETLSVNTPTMFFHSGDGLVEWIKPTQSHTYKLERSLNGGAWTTIATTGATVDSVGRKYTYQDTTLPTNGKVQYRVIVTSGGKTVTSLSNVVDVLPPAQNLAQNGGFEDGLTGWTKFGSDGTYRATNATAHTGSYSLELDYGSGEWQGMYQPALQVKPNTNYTLTYYYKHAGDDTANNCYCFVRGGDGTINAAEIVGQAYMNGGNTTEWKKETISFRTGDSDKLCIDFRVVAGTHTYIDDVMLVELL
ncbi:MAG: hypothetical protein E7527_02350 [Ruminococcaceae bacterium]|nr:hypothetical protein [Oscillospiraceae bacterium]